MPARGECLACSKLHACSETSVEKVKTSYTCSLFKEVPEAVYLARMNVLKKYGETVAIEAMLDRPSPTTEDGEDDGTT